MYDWKNEIHIHYILIHILVFGLIGIHFPQCVDFFGVNAIHKYGTYVWSPPSTPSVSTSSTSRSDSVRVCVLINLESITWQQSAAATGHAAYKYVDPHTHTHKNTHACRYLRTIYINIFCTDEFGPSVVVCVVFIFFCWAWHPNNEIANDSSNNHDHANNNDINANSNGVPTRRLPDILF